MPLYTTDALILRTYKLGESDRIVVFLTRDRGKKRGVAKNARQSRRRFGGALEPLTYGRVGYVERERRELVRLDYVEVVRSPLSAIDGEALGYVSYFAELIDEWAPEADPNEPLFRLGVSMVDAMAKGAPIEPLARYFEFWLLAAGRLPDRRAVVGRGAGVSRRGAAADAARARPSGGLVPRAARARSVAPRADRDAPGEGVEVGARVARHEKVTVKVTTKTRRNTKIPKKKINGFLLRASSCASCLRGPGRPR